MQNSILILFFCFFSLNMTFGQDAIRPLPNNINQPSVNLFAPYISGDGETMVYLTDYADDGHHTMYWATRHGVSQWNDGKEINSLVNRPTLNFRGGYSLNFDGDQLYFTSRKSGLGGFDIWYSTLKNGDWAAPKNIGKPINTASNDGSPVLSPDGEYLYFMRCETMSEYQGATGCQLMVSKRSFTGWDEAVPLPENINTGNSQTPRILADGETLLFSSDKMGGKGGLDLFLTRKTADGWSDPMPMTFLNTTFNDAFVSVPSKGRYIYESIKGDHDFILVESLLPQELRPSRVMRVRGKVMDKNSGASLSSHLIVFDVIHRSRLFKFPTDKQGDFAIVLKEGSKYDLSITADKPGYNYFSKSYDLKEIGPRDKEIMRVILSPLKNDTEISQYIQFIPHTSQLNGFSDFEIRRITQLMNDNPNLTINIDVTQKSYLEDSVRSSPDLTEIRHDTLWTPPADTLIDNPMTAQFKMVNQTIDSVYFVPIDSTIDSIRMVFPSDYIKIQTVYHNDRTKKEVDTIRTALLEKGIQNNRMSFTANIIKQKAEEEIDSVAVIPEKKDEEYLPTEEVRIRVNKN